MAATADFDVEAYLLEKGLTAKKGPGPERIYPCFFDCGESAESRKRKLYVNVDEGFYHCKVCGIRGGTTLLLRHFGDEPVAELPGVNRGERRRILNEAADLAAEWLAHDDDMLLHLLNERGLSPETIMERRLGVISRRRSLAGSITADARDMASTGLVYRDGPREGQDFFYNHLLVPYLHRGQVVQMRGKAMGGQAKGRYMTGPGESVRLYNIDSLDEAEDVVITEGEFDCIALAQALGTSPEDRVRRTAVVGTAGTDALPQDFASYFDQARRVFIGYDPDEPGKRGAVRLKEMLGARARVLELPDQQPKCDWTEFLLPIPADASPEWKAKHPHAGHTWRDVIDLMGSAAGKRLFSVGDAAHRWRNSALEGRTGMRMGFNGLDDTVHPGLKAGQVVVILAKTGVGKTIWLCNLAYNVRFTPTLFISLEQTAEEVYERLRRIYLFHHPRASDHEIEQAFSKLMICEENRLDEKDFASLVEEFEIETGVAPECAIVDYLGYYARGQPGGGPYEKVSNAVMQLKAEAKEHRLVVFSPHQVNRLAKEGKPIDLDDARDSGVVEETADFLMSIWRPDDALTAENQQPSGKLRLTLLKSRHGGKGRSFTLQMDLLTLAIVDDDGGQLAKRAAHHNYMLWRGQTYEDLRKEQTRPAQMAAAL